MKTTFKLFWGIVIVTITIFSMTSCLSFSRNNISDKKSLEWPSEATWEKHGVLGGLLQPTGTTVVFVGYPTMGPMAGQFIVTLHDADMMDFNSIVSQIEAKSGWEVFSNDSGETGAIIGFILHVSSTVTHTLAIVFGDNELAIHPEIITL